MAEAQAAGAIGSSSRTPDGIGGRHIERGQAWWLNPIGLAVLATLVGLALLGVFGREHTLSAEGGGVTLSVHQPQLLRSGEFFETQVRVEVSTAVEDLVIAVDTSLWRDMTVNTFIPAASEESTEDGAYRFAFGPMEAGTTFEAKIDLQVNPDIVGGNRGVIRVYDGERLLVELPADIGVLP